MIISQSPLRVSFFGGGTDYPEYFASDSGAVLGTAIDKSSFVSATPIYSRLFDYTIKISYRRTEAVTGLDAIEHAPYRECLRWCGITHDVEVAYFSELPAFSGLGSSSTFVVGLLNTLQALKGRSVPALELSYQAIELEREVLKEAVGCQDQVFAAMGGFNLVEFRTTRNIAVHRIPLSRERLDEFQDHLLVFYTGIQRHAHCMATKQIRNVELNRRRLRRMRTMVDEGHAVLTEGGCLERFGRLLHECWRHKSELADGMSNDAVAAIYAAALEAGAWGGKLLGAGGGGFILFFAPPERQAAVRERLAHLQEIAIRINATGSRIIHADPHSPAPIARPAPVVATG